LKLHLSVEFSSEAAANNKQSVRDERKKKRNAALEAAPGPR
jgi:hypothetical protein